MVRKFTSELADLYVRQNMTLSESLQIMMHKNKKRKNRISRSAAYLFECLQEGNLISNAFRTCPFINFDDSYTFFISLSEKSGDLRKTLEYLNLKYERKYQNKNKLLEVSLYPFFVVSLAVLASLFVCNLSGDANYGQVLNYLFFLVGVCGSIFFVIGKIISEDKLYEAFLGIDFLIKAGVNVSAAVASAVYVLGADSRLGKSFVEAGEKLEFGMSLQNAFCLGKKYQEAFYYADSCGKSSEVFKKLAVWIDEKAQKRRKLCLCLVEPLFICVTGVFLLCLVMKFFMPFMNDMKFF